jgi:hypothetical protein
VRHFNVTCSLHYLIKTDPVAFSNQLINVFFLLFFFFLVPALYVYFCFILSLYLLILFCLFSVPFCVVFVFYAGFIIGTCAVELGR